MRLPDLLVLQLWNTLTSVCAWSGVSLFLQHRSRDLW